MAVARRDLPPWSRHFVYGLLVPVLCLIRREKNCIHRVFQGMKNVIHGAL